MEIIEFFSSERQNHWLSEIKKSDWETGQYLYCLLVDHMFMNVNGDGAKLYLGVDGENLLCFCAFSKKSYAISSLSPWISFVYTFPQYRGNKYALHLIEEILKDVWDEYVYVSTPHVGLYEKMNFTYISDVETIDGDTRRLYRRKINHENN